MSNQDHLPLTGKRALITGSARRLGAAIATRLHGEGARVAIHYRRSEQEALALCEQLNSQRPDSAKAFQANLLDSKELHALSASVTEWLGGLDILVNNASSFYPTPIGNITLDQWDDLVGSNLKAPLFLSQELLGPLRSSKGAIVNIVDIHAVRPLRDHPVYGSAKAGLIMLTKSLAKDLAPDIRVNGVAPGAIMWPEDGMSAETRQKIIDQVPMQRQGNPGDIANAVLYLVRDSEYVTGQIMAVDGGRSLGW